MGSSLPEANYLDNLPKRLREEKKHQNWRDEEAQEQFLLDNWSDHQGGGNDLPFSMDMEDVEADVQALPLERESAQTPSGDYHAESIEPSYVRFTANGPR